jgi:uncharacterized protein
MHRFGRASDVASLAPSNAVAGAELLRAPFRGAQAYTPAASAGYQLLPLRFLRLDEQRSIITNLVGQHMVLPTATVHALLQHALPDDSEHFADLEARHFLLRSGEGRSDVALDLLAAQVRTRLAPLADFTALHIFVVTLRCDTVCPYCQVSRVSENRLAYDMSAEVADLSVDLAFQSPSPAIKIEFQGGEPLLNFPIIHRIVERANAINTQARKQLGYVVTTNLAPLSPEMLEFFRANGVVLSTSLDGPEPLHNANRPRASADSHRRTEEGIVRARGALGPGSVNALMTTTRKSLEQAEAIIDEYVRLGFDSVFLRPLSPFGYAAKHHALLGYTTREWTAFYERALNHILRLNYAGVPMREEYAAIILRRLLTPHAGGYVDLQSPTGLGISVAVYNYDGDVYMSDEARMLAEMGDHTFRLGNVKEHSYEQMFHSEALQSLVFDTMTEATPQCAACAFQPICGTDPVYHHATQGDAVGHRPTSGFCRRQMHVMKLLVRLLEDDAQAREVLLGWAFSNN